MTRTGSIPREWVLSLPWTSPPLHENQRIHWATKAALTRTVRGTAEIAARNAHIPPLAACEVTLYWAPPDRRRRDAENPVPTSKAACDGLVDAGIVRDDTPDLMRKHMPIITTPTRPARMWLVVKEATP